MGVDGTVLKSLLLSQVVAESGFKHYSQYHEYLNIINKFQNEGKDYL